MSNHASYKYSVSIKSDDLALIYCLRALSMYSQKTGNNTIPWGGTKNEDWNRDDHTVTFRFTSQEYREGFMKKINQLLTKDLWMVVEKSDDNPAQPQ